MAAARTPSAGSARRRRSRPGSPAGRRRRKRPHRRRGQRPGRDPRHAGGDRAPGPDGPATCDGWPNSSTELEAVEVVVGLPRTLADRTGPVRGGRDRTRRASLARRVAPTPVRLADERLTTVTAQRSLREAGVRARGQRAMIDQAAAVGILAELAGPAARSSRVRRGRQCLTHWDRERATPVAVGPPRRRLSRAERMREARRRRRRRLVRGFTLCVFIVIVIGAVFLGSRLWHTIVRSGQRLLRRRGVDDVVIQIHDGDSTTAIGKTLERAQGRRDRRKPSSAPRRATPRSRRSSPVSTRCAPRYRRRMPLRGLRIRRTGSASW